MVRKIRDNLYLETRDMTKEELIEFYSQSSKNADSKNKKKSKLKAA
jgi:hypothetical protein